MQKYLKVFLVSVIILLFFIFLLNCSNSNEGSYEDTQLISFYSSDSCISRTRQYVDSAEAEIEVDGFDISITHKNSMFNCCLDSIKVEFTQNVDTLKLTEVEFSTVLCDCVCPFEVCATIGVSEPGSYLVQIFKYDYHVPIYQEWVEVP